MTKQEMELWKADSIKQAEAELYGELLAAYAEMPFVGLSRLEDEFGSFGEGWR